MISQLITSLGGPQKVADYCVITEAAVRGWRTKGKIPKKWFPKLEKMLDSKSGGLERSRRMIEILRSEK